MKIPEARRLPSGSWHIQLRLGGQSYSITKDTETECRREAQLIKAQYMAGTGEPLSKAVRDLTLKEAQEQFVKARKAVMSPATVRSYESYIKNRWPLYRDKPLTKINWQRMVTDELADVSPKTVKNAWALVRSSLQHAGYTVPSVRLAQVPVKDLAFLEPEELPPFIDALRGKSYEIPALLLLHGLRLSEVLGLDWENIKLDKKRKTGTITVSGAVVRGTNGLVRKETNKNRTSSRTVPVMIPRLYELLEASQSASGPLVHIHPSNLLDDVKLACKRAGVTVCTCHDLRRSFVSLCYHLKISEHQVMSWAGYSDINVMHRIYVKLASSDRTKDRDTMTAFFKNANKRSQHPKRYRVKGSLA